VVTLTWSNLERQSQLLTGLLAHNRLAHNNLSTFKRDSNKVMRQMKKTKEPVVLTVNGKAAVVVQDAESYQKLLELKERSEVVEILCQRLASRSRKKGGPAEDFFNEFFAKNNIPVED
jgi:prevent-host-death family protein